MSEFKYACPVCGQHMRCDVSQAGTVMECPTCFQKITAPQSPAAGSEQKFVLTGTRAGERALPKIALETPVAPPSPRHFSGLILLLILILTTLVLILILTTLVLVLVLTTLVLVLILVLVLGLTSSLSLTTLLITSLLITTLSLTTSPSSLHCY